MAITESISPQGVKEFTVYVNLRSKPMPHLRFQKRINGLRTMTEAQRVEKNLLKELATKVAHSEGHGFTWRMIIDKWASFVESPYYMDRRYNPSTVRDYVSMMHIWTKRWLDMPATEISRGDGREVLDNVIQQGRSKAFQKRLKNTINMIYNWGIETKIIRGVTYSPVFGVKITLKEDKKPEILKLDEIRLLLSEARARSHPWFHVWGLALLTGMRNGELFALKWSDIDLDKRLMTVQRSYNKRNKEFKSTKAGYWRSVPISSELHGLLLELKNNHEFVLPRMEAWIQGQQAKVLKSFCREIGIPEIKFHTLRACFATQLISDGVEPIKVMKVCGWQDLKTMARYLRLSGVEEKGVTDGLSFLPNNTDNIILINTARYGN